MSSYFIFVIAFALFETFLVYLFLHKLLEENDKAKITRIGSFIIFCSGLIIMNLLVQGNGIITITYVFISMMILSQTYFKGSIHSKLLFTFMFCIFIIVAELLNMFILELFIDDINVIGENGILRIIANLISCIWLFIFVQFICRNRKSKEQKIKRKYWILLLSVACISLINAYNMAMYKSNYGEVNVLFTIETIGMIYINIFIFYLVENILEKHELETQNKLLLKQIEYQKEDYHRMYRHQEEIRRIKHDIHNHHTCIDNFLRNSNVEEAIHYLHSISNVHTENRTVMSGNPIVDALINSTLNRCKEAGITSLVKVNMKNMKGIEQTDLCVVLGNALDNAIEACRDVKDKGKRYIDISIETKLKYIVIQVKNPTSNNEVERNGILPTKKKDKLNHGLGLGNVKIVVEKYDGEMITRKEGNIFHFSAMMKYKEKYAKEEVS